MKASIITVISAVVLSLAAVLFLSQHQVAPAGGTSPIDNVNYHCWAGVCEYFGSTAMKVATSTPCAIQSPAATSTLGIANIRVDIASTTATNWFIGTGSTAFATTTAYGGISAVGASKQGFIQGSTSPAAGSNTVLAPNTWLIFQNNLGITAGDTVGAGFAPSGTCFAKFTVPQS